MAFDSIGNLASSLLLRHASVKAKQNLVRLSSELTSGITSDVRDRLRNDLSKQYDWEHGISKNYVLEKTLSEAVTKIQAKQTVLEAISETTVLFANNVSIATNANGDSALNTLSEQAEQSLSQVLSHLNAKAMGQSLFAGSYSDMPAVSDAESILNSVKTYLGDVSSSASVVHGVQAWMEDAVTGYQSVAYTGSLDNQAPIRVSNDRTIEETTKANDPPVRALVESFILAALSAASGPLDTENQRITLLQIATDKMRSANDQVIELQASIGFSEAVITRAKVATSVEVNALEQLRAKTLGVDEFEIASMIQETELQLEKIYTMTARASRMSLLEYLK